jgi:Spy/CpxP family protein refolding chaperone
MHNKTLKYILILSVLLNISMLASAFYTHYARPRFESRTFAGHSQKAGEMSASYVFEELSLTPDQRKTMQHKAMTFHADLERKGQLIDQKRQHLLTLMRADDPDKRPIEATIAEIAGLQHDVQKAAVAHMLEFKALLDKDQQTRFFDLIGGAMKKSPGLSCPQTGSF